MAAGAVTGARRRIGVGLVALVVATGMGCAECHPRRAPPPNNPATITAEDRFTAMMSVHAYAYHRAGILPLSADELDLPSLRRIVAVLTEDRDPFATSRRRRAVAQLAAYAGTTDPDDELVQTWQALLFNDPQLIRSVDEVLVDRIGKVDATEIEKEIYNLLHGLTPPYVEKGSILTPGPHPAKEAPPCM